MHFLAKKKTDFFRNIKYTWFKIEDNAILYAYAYISLEVNRSKSAISSGSEYRAFI